MVDVDYALSHSNVKSENKRITNKECVSSYIREMNEIYKKEKEEKKKELERKNEKVDFTLRDRFSGGVRVIKSAMNSLRVFCDNEDFKINVYENYGWLFGSAEFIIKGNTTRAHLKEIEKAYHKWVRQYD